MNLTDAFKWLETRLDEGAWFRRLYVIFATVLTWKTTAWAFLYASENAAKPGIDVAAVIGAVSAVPGTLVGFAFKQYVDSKR